WRTTPVSDVTACVAKGVGWWALQDLNLGPMDYESTALTAELRARSVYPSTLTRIQHHSLLHNHCTTREKFSEVVLSISASRRLMAAMLCSAIVLMEC